jgi:DNA-binding ferritin-like protein
MDYHNPKDFFEDLLQYWCVSWMVSSLIRYKDTHKFFDEHYDEIQEIREELHDQWVPVEIPTHTDLKNFLSWLSFEERAREIYYSLEMDCI